MPYLAADLGWLETKSSACGMGSLWHVLQYSLTLWHCPHVSRPLASAVLPCAYSHASGCGMRMSLWHLLQASFLTWQALQVESTPTAPWRVDQSDWSCETGLSA